MTQKPLHEPTDLIARIEAASGPDRDLDFAIAAAVGWPDSPYSREHARRYTEVIDSAVTLVPEGWAWEVYSDGSALVWRQPAPDAIRQTGSALRCASPAIALCAAALRARKVADAA